MEGDGKNVVRRLFDEVLDAGNLNVVEMLVGINYKEHSALLGQPDGREGVRFRIEALRGAFREVRNQPYQKKISVLDV